MDLREGRAEGGTRNARRAARAGGLMMLEQGPKPKKKEAFA